MSDPTVPVLITAFSGAIGVFVLAALVRWSRSRGQSSAGVPEIHASPSLGEILPPPQPGFFPNVTPYQPPASQPALVPPPVPSGVPVWPYRAIDFILAAVIVGIFGALSIATAMTDPEKMEFSAVALISSIVLQFTLAGITLSFVIWRIGPVAWLGLNWKSWPWVFLLAPAVVGVMWLVFGGLQLAGYMKWIESFGVESLQDSVKLLQTSKDTVVLALMAVAAVVVAPVCEELIFRGYLFAFAKKYTGTWVAAICSGLIFAAAHGSLAALLPLFIFGIVLALLYEKTGSIWAPIAVHFCFNGATVGIQFLARQFPQLLEQAPKWKRLSDIGEDALIDRLVGLVPTDPGMAGPGDDCAVIDPGHGSHSLQLLKTDALVERVHFLKDAPPRAVGWKSIARVISDFAAMGGKPEHFLVTLALPKSTAVSWIEDVYRGIGDCLEKFGCKLAGGETSSVPEGSMAVISIAATGSVARGKVVLRSTAKIGDSILVTGKLGGSLAGKHLDFTPRLAEAAWLVAHFKPTAMMDLSDGLGKDLPRLSAASGTGFIIDESVLPLSENATTSQAIGDGEDFELLFCIDPRETPDLLHDWHSAFPEVPLTVIGKITSPGKGMKLGGGWDHFGNP